MATLAKEIAEAAVVTSGKSVKTTGANGLAQMEEKETNKKVSINQVIESCLNLPTIEGDAVFGSLFASAPNDIAKNGIKTAWLQLPNIQEAFNISYSGIVEACSGSLDLSLSAALVDEYCKKFGCGAVVFKNPAKDAKVEDLTQVTLTISGEAVTVNMVCECYEDAKVDYKKRVAALASAFRLHRQMSKGVKTTAELLATAEKAILDLKARGVELAEVLEAVKKLYE